ncbi:Crp/Fnr family transcriptional regulator [Phaeocystidibacter marisrubri]|uniref:Crp/Fnr family transcriptional regulator n=1 Tax=Phaeocystidibacter marisrubri TaxID=1577780 RepID=A0A6L3ZCP6_9FLAO|nr:Crp/Fnr family transcriptional regulator [Phaeocystidibacter marisrubri]KAB2815615.1 Crp/Fnr family transcriptional regulator [Phaeocystidibacter marisrubri]GGH64809.1 cAMP-binding protein [Phaeocystidibacter marisrubri]
MREYLKSFDILTEDEIDLFEKLIVRKSIKKGDFFIQEGHTCKEIAFIESGLFRSYYYSSEGEEVTYCFSFSNSFTSAYSSFLSQTPTVENIQALTDCELLTISRREILKLEKTSYNWLKLFKVMAEQEFIGMEKRIFLLQRGTAEIRYRDLLSHQPEYLRLIPLSYLSSYLGVTPRHLSRIRKAISN